MKRFLAFLLAFLIPLQSAIATIVPIAGTGHLGCEQGLTLAGPQGHRGKAAADRSACDCDGAAHSGAHGIVHSHACPHLGVATVAVASACIQPYLSAGPVPEAMQAAFISVVLDVPSPPPTRFA
jgi:hypothetical protein